MLKPAYPLKKELNEAYHGILFQDKYKYYNAACYWDMDMDPQNSSWEGLDFVSVDEDGKILGRLKAKIDRTVGNTCSSLLALNFGEKNMTFSRDFHQFLTDLFERFGMRRVEFRVTLGNPAEAMYDRMVHRYGGRIVGVLREDTMLHDGKLYGSKIYEILASDYHEVKKRRASR